MSDFTTFQTQYLLIKDMREVLFKYCESISKEHFVKEVESFSGSSIRDLIVHIHNVYRHWIGNFALREGISLIEYSSINSIAQVKELFSFSNLLINDFLVKYKNEMEKPFTSIIPFRNIEYLTTPLMVFTHAITHEFHHKGQILTMSRLLGYTPIDTDIIRF